MNAPLVENNVHVEKNALNQKEIRGLTLIATDFTSHYILVSDLILKNPLIAINIGTLLAKA